MSSPLSKAKSAVAKLVSVLSVQEPKDLNYTINPIIWNYDKHGNPADKFDFTGQVSAVRVWLSTSQASTVEIDLEDSDFEILENPLFANWSFEIEDVSVDSNRKFKPTRLTNSTSTARLGNTADLEWVLGQRPIDLELGDVYFRLCNIQSQQTTITLGFEDRVASKLRQKSGVKSWDRSQHTRAQFVAMLCREAGVDYFIPELDVKQPVEVDLSASGTFPNATGTTNFVFTAAGNRAFTAGQRTFITDLASLTRLDAGVLAAWVYGEENGSAAQQREAAGNHNWLNIGYFDSGPGQIAFNSAFGDPSTAALQTSAFLSGTWGGASPGIRAIMRTTGQSPTTQIAAIQHSGWATSGEPNLPSDYSLVTKSWMKKGAPVTTGSSSSSSTSTGNYAFTRGPNEDSWDCIQRLASEVAWYAFVRQNRLWYVSGNYLFQQDPQLSAQNDKNGVNYIDVDLDMGARDQVAQCDVYARSDLWAALPGMIVEVLRRGPANGKWMVGDVQSNPLDPTQDAQISIYKPIPKRGEPATDNKTSSTNAAVTADGGNKVLAAYQIAKLLSGRHYIYDAATAGPYYRNLYPQNQLPPPGSHWLDCSGSVSEVLWLAGFTLPDGSKYPHMKNRNPPTSGDFVPGAAGLLAGKGKYMTIYGGPSHVFIEFNLPGVGHFQGNTVSGQGGFRLFSWNASFTGGWGGPNPGAGGAGPFAPVHYPGT